MAGPPIAQRCRGPPTPPGDAPRSRDKTAVGMPHWRRWSDRSTTEGGRHGKRPIRRPAAGAGPQPRGRGDQSPIWSQAVTVVFETDPEAIASVLPRPLEPLGGRRPGCGSPSSTWAPGSPPFGAGWFGVRARHGDVEGEYALFMPMTTEQATDRAGARPSASRRRSPSVTLDVDGDHARRPHRPDGIDGGRGGRHPRARSTRATRSTSSTSTSSACPDPSGSGLEGDPALVYCRRHETARVVRPVNGECKLLEAPLDPIADFPVEEVLSFEYAEIASSPGGRDRGAGCRPSGSIPSSTSATTT